MRQSNPPLIAVAGKARSGKDTAGNFIIAAGGGTYKYGLADPIRRMLHAGLGIDVNDPYWASRKEDIIPAIGKSPRQLMQTLGTEWGRDLVTHDLWLTMAKNTLLQRGPGMVICDARFDNEAQWVRDVGGLVLHLNRSGAVKVAAHSSEGGISFQPGDIMVDNNGTLDALQTQIESIFHGGQA